MSTRSALLLLVFLGAAPARARDADFFDIPINGSRRPRATAAKPVLTTPDAPVPAAELPEVSAGLLKDLQVYEDMVGEITAELVTELRENLVGKLKQHQTAAQKQAELDAARTIGHWIGYFERRETPVTPVDSQAGNTTELDYKSALPEATGALIKKFFQFKEEASEEAASVIRKKRETTAQNLLEQVPQLTELGDVQGATGTRHAAHQLLKSEAATTKKPGTEIHFTP